MATLRARLVVLRHRNFRLYVFGQLVSLAGTFMHTVGEAWLVLDLGGSGTQLGLVLMLQFLPVLLLGTYGGVIADRFDRRRTYLATQIVGVVLALVLGVLTVTDTVTIWMVAVVALAFGCNAAVDQPVRQGLVHDIVGDERLPAAIGLSMTVMNLGGAVGPAAAALVIATLGVGACFLLNAASFTAVLVAMLLMRPAELQVRARPATREPRQVRAGLRYVASHPELGAPVVLLFLFGLAWQEEVLLPMLARYTFDSSASLFGVLATAMAIGAVAGGVVTTSGRPPSEGVIVRSALVFAASVVGVALAPVAIVAVGLLLVTGAAAVILVVQLNSILQLRVASEYRGRVMALYVLCMYGTRPLGAPVLGWIGSTTSPRVALLVAPALVACVGLPAWSWLQARGSTTLEPHVPTSR